MIDRDTGAMLLQIGIVLVRFLGVRQASSTRRRQNAPKGAPMKTELRAKPHSAVPV